MKLYVNSRGDTIVEVLVSIAALSLLIASSYVLANRSSQAVRQSQERGEVTKLAESNIERLKQYIGNAGSSLPADGAKFCMKSDGSAQVFTAAQNPPTDAQLDDFTKYPNECKTGDYYSVFIERVGDTYTAHGRWLRATGSGVDETTMVYRVYPDAQAQNEAGTIAATCAFNEFRHTSFGVCKPCNSPYYPANYTSPGGNPDHCDPIPPKITATVRLSDDCTAAHAVDRAGIPVSLSGGVATASQNTSGSPSAVTFSGLLFGTSYTVGYTVPPGTNPGGGASYSACGATTAGVNTLPDPGHAVGVTDPGHAAGSVSNVSFLFSRNCYQVDDYGWRDHGYDYDANAGNAEGLDPYTEWWQHTGPDAYHSEFQNKDGTYPSDRYAWENPDFGRTTYGSSQVYVHYGLLSGHYYNRFEKWWGYTGHVYDWRHHYDWRWEVTGHHTACPA